MNRTPLRKRLFKHPLTQWLLSWLASVLLRSIYLTCRVEHRMDPAARPYMRGESQAVFCFWHGRMILHPFVKPPRRRMFVLISHHNDGAFITAVMRRFGIDAVRGSKRVGGTRALLNLMRVRESGDNISITPDGPRGPFQVAAPGAAYVAAKTGMPLMPITFSASRGRQFATWDRFFLPAPFAQVTFVFGAPIMPDDPSDAGVAAMTATLEQSLRALTAQADAQTGWTA